MVSSYLSESSSREARLFQAREFKLEMGVGDTSAAREEPELEVPEQERESGAKTVGRQRTKSD